MPNTVSDRTFGVELELVGISRSAMAAAIDAIPGVSARSESYNHDVSQAWKVVSDGSVYSNGSGGAGEAVSPILHGEDGIEELVKVVKALRAAGATVNRTCGLHVHVGVSDLLPKDLINIVQRYARYEESIDAFMPQSRRGSTPEWCHSVIGLAGTLERGTYTSCTQVVRAQHGRYYKVNLDPWSRQKTIEFRQHSGSCNARKVESWARFVLEFTEASVVSTPEERAAGVASVRASEPRRGLRGVAAKLERVRRAFLASDSRSLAPIEIGALGGWSRASVPVYISRMRTELGLRIVFRRARYILQGDGQVRLPSDETASTTTEHLQAARTVTIEEDSLFRGISDSITEFYEMRTEDLAT